MEKIIETGIKVLAGIGVSVLTVGVVKTIKSNKKEPELITDTFKKTKEE